MTTHWLDDLPAGTKVDVAICMRRIFDESARHYDDSRPTDDRLPIGSSSEEAAQKGEALSVLLRHIRSGNDPHEAALKARMTMVAIVKAHNKRRPGDVNWQRHVNCHDALINGAADSLIKATTR